MKDIRWEQRFSNFNKALAKLKDGVKNIDPNFKIESLDQDDFELSELEIEGVIQRFEYTHELAWNVMKDYINFLGVTSVAGSRDATREAFKIGIVEDGQGWMNMIKSRNQTSHTYDKETANKIFIAIVKDYYPLFNSFQAKMLDLKADDEPNLFTEEL